MVPWLAFPALSPCEADYVWVLVHILQTSLQEDPTLAIIVVHLYTIIYEANYC